MSKNEMILNIYEEMQKLDLNKLELIRESVKACVIVQNLIKNSASQIKKIEG